eukprot:Em0001g1846a
MNRKGVIQKVAAEGTISKYHVLFEGDSKPQEVTSRAIQCDPAFLPHSPQQVKQPFIAAEVLMSPASNFDEEGEQGNTQGAVQDTSIDDDDESGTEDQPMFDDIPDSSMQQLLETGTTIPKDDATNPLIAHGLKWTLEECISMDVCRDQPKNTIINFPNGVVPDLGNFYSIWKLLFPYDIMPDCVQNTSLLLEKGGLPPTTSTEMEKWFGITFARTLFKEQGRDLWRTEMHVESCCLPAAFGTRFGMSRNRYDSILSCLRFGKFSDLELLHNPWLPVQCFIDAFNTNQTKIVSPGTFILLDEIMSSWLGLEADYSLNGIPHKTKIKRKPKGVRVELKALIDYSAFSSVATAVALKQHGTYFIGIVKTAHKMYPKQFMGTHDFSKRGDHVALSANVQGHQLFAVGWLDGKRKDLVSACGTTLPSTPATRTRQEVVVSADKGVSTRPYLRTTPGCNIVASYFDNFHFIDVHDHMRQGILKLEQHWLTRNWVYRVLSTLFGVIVTDCYYASR